MLSTFSIASPRMEKLKRDENGLSMLDRQILVCLANGMTLQDQATELGYAIDSIETYRLRLYRKIGVKNGAAAVAWGFKNKYLI